MVFPDFAGRGFDHLHEKFEEGRFSHAVGAYDGHSRGEIDAELEFPEQQRLIRVAKGHVVRA